MKLSGFSKSSGFAITIILLAFSLFVYLNPKLFTYKFFESKISDYLRSQDILDIEDRIKDRITVSDSDIYEAAGVMYLRGSDPRDYNFQHPPLIKYLFGISAFIFGNPYIVQIIFGMVFLMGIFFLGKIVFKNEYIGLMAAVLMLIDPVFKEVILYTLLDLGQMSFFVWFLVTYLISKKSRIIPGILLGLSIASKFYTPIIFYALIIFIWEAINKKTDLMRVTVILGIAALVFCLTYAVAFPFNIIFWQAKVIKYMLHHDSAGTWGSVIPIFFGGYFMWTVSFIATTYELFKSKFKEVGFLISLLPVTYLILMTFQTPFERYFILILPFLYLGLSDFVLTLFKDNIMLKRFVK